MKISFDFDSTLAEDRIQKLAKVFINDGHEVWITTTRPKAVGINGEVILEHRDLYAVAKELNIPEERIQMTGGTDKWRFLDGFDIHFDDDKIEVELIEENLPSCSAVLILDV